MIRVTSYGPDLVLDEADRMLDMGFIHDIRKIVAKLPAAASILDCHRCVVRPEADPPHDAWCRASLLGLRLSNRSNRATRNRCFPHFCIATGE
jgi:hypothetical protein